MNTVFHRCMKCDHESRLHTGAGCEKCSCAASPREIMEMRLLATEDDLRRLSVFYSDLRFRVEALENAIRAYGILS